MAIGVVINGNVGTGGAGAFVPCSARGSWTTVNEDAETAQSATDLLRPAAIDDAVFHWMKVGDGTSRCMVRARQAVAATVTTSPVVRVFAAYGTPDSSGAFADDGTVKFCRLDNVDWNAAGLTLTLVTSGTGLNRDTSYAYTDVMPDLTGLDLKGAWYIGVAVETAANVDTGTVPIEVLLLN